MGYVLGKLAIGCTLALQGVTSLLSSLLSSPTLRHKGGHASSDQSRRWPQNKRWTAGSWQIETASYTKVHHFQHPSHFPLNTMHHLSHLPLPLPSLCQSLSLSISSLLLTVDLSPNLNVKKFPVYYFLNPLSFWSCSSSSLFHSRFISLDANDNKGHSFLHFPNTHSLQFPPL